MTWLDDATPYRFIADAAAGTALSTFLLGPNNRAVITGFDGVMSSVTTANSIVADVNGFAFWGQEVFATGQFQPIAFGNGFWVPMDPGDVINVNWIAPDGGQAGWIISGFLFGAFNA